MVPPPDDPSPDVAPPEPDGPLEPSSWPVVLSSLATLVASFGALVRRGTYHSIRPLALLARLLRGPALRPAPRSGRRARPVVPPRPPPGRRAPLSSAEERWEDEGGRVGLGLLVGPGAPVS